MRYRQTNQPYRSSDQQAKELINNNDVLSTKEQEEVIAYFARSLRVSTQFLKVVVSLHALVALVYVFLTLSGSLMFDLEVDQATTSRLLKVGQLHLQAATEKSTSTTTANMIPTSTRKGAPSTAPGTPDPLAVLAALDVQQRAANRKYTQDYLERRGGGLSSKAVSVTNALSVMVMLYSAGLLLWAAWSGYKACRLLRVNVEDLTGTEPRELGTSSTLSPLPASSTTAQRHSETEAPSHDAPPWGKWQRLRPRIRSDPPVTQYAIAALAAVASCFWLVALLRRQWAMRRAYVAAGLPPPSVLSTHKVTDAVLEYVLAVWQPLFHLAIGRLLRSMLDTKDNLIMLSKMKYRFDKV